MESGLTSLSKAKSSVRTFIRFSPKKKNDKDEWNFVFGQDGKSIRVGKKSALGKTRFCSITDEIFTEDACNSEVYRKMGLQQYAINVLDGISTNVIVCGPHKTGKTHTLVGSQRSVGLVLQTIYDIFAAIRCYSSGIHLNEKGVNTDIGGNFDRLFVVKASVLEISENSSNYKIDNVHDLINPENPLQLVKKIGGLGYLIKGEPEHLFEKEEKLVSAILCAVSRKKVLDSIRKRRYRGNKNSIPKSIKNSVFGPFGEKWLDDDIVGNLMITITVESADKSEIENKVTKNSNVANSTSISIGSIRFFEVSSCLNSDLQTKTIIPMFGLLDLAHEIRKYTYTNEKSNNIDITSISSCIASTIVESDLLVLGTLTEAPIEKKCCIRPILTPYDNQSTVQPSSIFDTLQFIEYIGNSMKFPVFPQRSCLNRPLLQSKLIEILRKNIKNSPKLKLNDKMIIKSDKGIWHTESSGRVTRIIRLLTFINQSSDGSAILRILMSGNDEDILKIYFENMIGSNLINIDDEQLDNSTFKWIKYENFGSPKKLNIKQNKFLFNQDIKSNEFGFTTNKINPNNGELYSGNNTKKSEEIDYLENSKIRNLYFSERNEIDKDIRTNNSEKFTNKPKVRFDDLLISEKNESFDVSKSDENMADIFNSKNFEENIHDTNTFNLNLCEKIEQKKNVPPQEGRFVSKANIDRKSRYNKNGSNLVDNGIVTIKKSEYNNEGVGKTYKSLNHTDEKVEKTHKSLNFVDEGVGNTHKSLNFVDEEVGVTHRSLDFVDEVVGNTYKSLNFVDEGVGETHRSLDFVDEGVGNTYKSLNFVDEEVETNSNYFNPVKQYEELLEKTKSLNKLQKSIMDAHKNYGKGFSEYNSGDNIYELEINGKKPSRRFPLVNEKALEASRKAVEASRKALEASRNLYERETKHSRGKIHEVIPKSKHFPQVDIYAPAYDSDIDYEYYHTPGNIRFGIERSNETNNERDIVPNKGINHRKKFKDNDKCPCCIDYTKVERCRCHYKDASVNFVGISETSVNTDRSLLQLYEPGAGINEKLKPNGRSWDIIFNSSNGTVKKKLGFRKKKQNVVESDLIDNSSHLSLNNSIENLDENIYLESESIYTDDDDDDYENKYSKDKNDITTFPENVNQTNSSFSKMGNFDEMILNSNIFKPLYLELGNNNYPIFNRTVSIKNKNQSSSENETHKSGNNNLNFFGCLINSNEVQRNEKNEHFNCYPNKFKTSDKLNLIDHYESTMSNQEAENFEIYNKDNAEKSKTYPEFSDYSFLEKIEEDIHNEMNEFPNISNIMNVNLKQNCQNTDAYTHHRLPELNNSTYDINHLNIGTPIEGIIREFGCCHVKYILPFPEELRPKVVRGKQSYTFPYLKSLY